MTQANVLAQIGATSGPTFRNRIINGAMVIDQRNAGALVNPALDSNYYLDRWAYRGSSASKFSVGQNAGSVTPPVGFTKYLGYTSLSSYSVAAGDFFFTYQAIEGYNIADLGFGTANAKTITISFWVRSSLTGTFGGTLRNGANNRYCPFSYTISSANTWEYETITIAGDTTGTWATDNSAGLYVYFNLGTGSTYSGGTSGVWGSTAYFTPAGATSVVGTNGATFYLTGVQLEVGSSATGYEYENYTSLLQKCQRYYETIGVVLAVTVPPYQNGYYKVNKRAAPTLTAILINAGSGGVIGNQTSPNDVVGYYQTAGNSTYSNSNWSVSAEL